MPREVCKILRDLLPPSYRSLATYAPSETSPTVVATERFPQAVALAQKIYGEIALEEMALAETYRPLIAETIPVYHIGNDDE
jgi:hypothetical protein